MSADQLWSGNTTVSQPIKRWGHSRPTLAMQVRNGHCSVQWPTVELPHKAWFTLLRLGVATVRLLCRHWAFVDLRRGNELICHSPSSRGRVMTVSLYCFREHYLVFSRSGGKQWQLSSEWRILEMELIDIEQFLTELLELKEKILQMSTDIPSSLLPRKAPESNKHSKWANHSPWRWRDYYTLTWRVVRIFWRCPSASVSSSPSGPASPQRLRCTATQCTD